MTWYTWLEQGRDIKPSDQVLEAVAATLRLDPHELAHSLWDRHEVRWMENLIKRLNHPAGRLEFDYTNLWFGPRSEIRLTTYTFQ